MIEYVAMNASELAAQIAREIERAPLPDAARALMWPCLQQLASGVANWQAAGSFAAPGLLVVGATPNAAALAHSPHWGSGVDNLDRSVVLSALMKAIEGSDPSMIFATLTGLLGEDGRAAVDAAALEAAEFGAQPILAVLTVPHDGEVSVLLVSAAVPPPVAPPSLLVH